LFGQRGCSNASRTRRMGLPGSAPCCLNSRSGGPGSAFDSLGNRAGPPPGAVNQIGLPPVRPAGKSLFVPRIDRSCFLFPRLFARSKRRRNNRCWRFIPVAVRRRASVQRPGYGQTWRLREPAARCPSEALSRGWFPFPRCVAPATRLTPGALPESVSRRWLVVSSPGHFSFRPLLADPGAARCRRCPRLPPVTAAATAQPGGASRLESGPPRNAKSRPLRADGSRATAPRVERRASAPPDPRGQRRPRARRSPSTAARAERGGFGLPATAFSGPEAVAHRWRVGAHREPGFPGPGCAWRPRSPPTWSSA